MGIRGPIQARWLWPVLCIAVSACFGPDVVEGLACGPGDACPPGQSCFAGTCRSSPSGDDDGGTAQLACEDFDAVFFEACDIVAPGPGLSLTEGVYLLDTDTAQLITPGGAQLDIETQLLESGALLVSTEALELEAGSELRAIGSHPVIIASFSVIEIDGVLDVGSRAADGPGAGAPRTNCASSEGGDGEDVSTGGGGGGGAGFGTAGGNGADGDANVDISMGGPGGASFGAPRQVVAGCSGGSGGDAVQVNSGGDGGAGGGAVHLSAAVSISITGTIDAGGAGGAGATHDSGGGGGGSGGFIGLVAPTISIEGATLAANGGGGGGGSGGGDIPAEPGADATPGLTPAQGGSGLGTGGNAASGATGTDDGGTPTEFPDGGGGGGGGGVGFIVSRGDLNLDGDETVSPPLGDL